MYFEVISIAKSDDKNIFQINLWCFVLHCSKITSHMPTNFCLSHCLWPTAYRYGRYELEQRRLYRTKKIFKVLKTEELKYLERSCSPSKENEVSTLVVFAVVKHLSELMSFCRIVIGQFVKAVFSRECNKLFCIVSVARLLKVYDVDIIIENALI